MPTHSTTRLRTTWSTGRLSSAQTITASRLQRKSRQRRITTPAYERTWVFLELLFCALLTRHSTRYYSHGSCQTSVIGSLPWIETSFTDIIMTGLAPRWDFGWWPVRRYLQTRGQYHGRESVHDICIVFCWPYQHHSKFYRLPWCVIILRDLVY